MVLLLHHDDGGCNMGLCESGRLVIMAQTHSRRGFHGCHEIKQTHLAVNDLVLIYAGATTCQLFHVEPTKPTFESSGDAWNSSFESSVRPHDVAHDLSRQEARGDIKNHITQISFIYIKLSTLLYA
jgi:hypothetical protein